MFGRFIRATVARSLVVVALYVLYQQRSAWTQRSPEAEAPGLVPEGEGVFANQVNLHV